MTAAIRLSSDQKKVVAHRGSDLQVIACAGSGKTESMARRVAALVEEGVAPAAIVAFTFTEKAAAELKERIVRRVAERLGEEARDRLGPMFVGTIHGFCHRVLLEWVPRYGNHDVLDENRHVGFLSRHYHELKLGELTEGRGKAIGLFLRSADVVANELIAVEDLAGTPFGESYRAYLDALDRFRFLTFGRLISEAVAVLETDPVAQERVCGPLRHLLVDEYQDINPAQERLIRILARRPVELCVVGDDDQSIYQWRGSDVANIVGFTKRRRRASQLTLGTNRRSRPGIVKAAAAFAESIEGRLPKRMRTQRSAAGADVVAFRAETDIEEANQVVATIEKLHRKGFRYRDLAILLRSARTSGGHFVTALHRQGIPFTCAGRSGLFLQPEISGLAEAFVWLADGRWKEEAYGPQRDADPEIVAAVLAESFGLDQERLVHLRKYLDDWKRYVTRGTEPVNLVGDLYRLLAELGASAVDPDSPEGSVRYGNWARLSKALADFEHVHRRGRWVEENGRRRFRGSQDRGKPYLDALARYLLYYAFDAYEEFDGEPAADLDAVTITTIHQAKGLEWPVVFLPALVKGRFPSGRTGNAQEWLLPEAVFPPRKRARYEGSDAEERRLFYVALTRARECVYLSCFERKTRAFRPSPYLLEVAGKKLPKPSRLPLPTPAAEATGPELPALEISFSELARYEECGFRYRLSSVLGFEQELALELGYGKAIHHVLRLLSEAARETGRLPSTAEVDRLLDEEFFLPFANRPAFDQMRRAARRIVDRYLAEHQEDLRRVWATERPFALHLPDGIVTGRADVILDREGGEEGALALVDYKSANDDRRRELFELQLRIYAAAGHAEGLDIRAAYLHELDAGCRTEVDVPSALLAQAREKASSLALKVRSGDFTARPSRSCCGACEWTSVCRYAQ